MKILILALLVLMAPSAFAQYSNDDLCRAIGETRAVALQPRDRLFFEKNCECIPGYSCYFKGSQGDLEARSAYQRKMAVIQCREESTKSALAQLRRKGPHLELSPGISKRVEVLCASSPTREVVSAVTPMVEAQVRAHERNVAAQKAVVECREQATNEALALLHRTKPTFELSYEITNRIDELCEKTPTRGVVAAVVPMVESQIQTIEASIAAGLKLQKESEERSSRPTP